MAMDRCHFTALTIIAYATNVRILMENPDPSPVRRPFYDGAGYNVHDSVGHQLHQLMVSMRRDIEQRMGAHDLTAAQWFPLWKIKLTPSSTAQELAREMAVDAGSMTRLIDRLESKGLVTRLRSETDRRVVNLGLTAAGEAVVQHVPQVLAEVNNHYLRGFDDADWRQLRKLLNRMLANAPMPVTATAPEPN